MKHQFSSLERDRMLTDMTKKHMIYLLSEEELQEREQLLTRHQGNEGCAQRNAGFRGGNIKPINEAGSWRLALFKTI